MTSHLCAADMAHMLTGYIACDKRIKRAIAEEFRIPISIGQIARIREARKQDEARFARPAHVWGESFQDPYNCTEYTRRIESMAKRNEVFVRALRGEAC